jgi:DNA-binding NarL/FixJ family response regulator
MAVSAVPPRTGAQVLLVDDHAIFREGVKAVLSQEPTLTVCGATGEPDEAIALACSTQPALVLLDDHLGTADGLALIEPLRESAPAISILVLSEMRAPDVRTRALRLGARGLLSKAEPGHVLLKAIRQVRDGELWFDRGTVSAAVSEMIDPRRSGDRATIGSLTDREREIVALVGAGLKTDAIASQLAITQKTVRNQMTVIYEKLGVTDRLELAIYAYRHGLAKLPS